jgi:hypothetical protein
MTPPLTCKPLLPPELLPLLDPLLLPPPELLPPLDPLLLPLPELPPLLDPALDPPLDPLLVPSCAPPSDPDVLEEDEHAVANEEPATPTRTANQRPQG